MPIANLLGVQFDMYLLGRLTISVVTVLFVSWAYRFYSSRTAAARKARLHAQAAPDRPTLPISPNGTCRKCKKELRPQSMVEPDTRYMDKQPPGPSQMSSDRDDLTLEGTLTGMEVRQTPQTGGTLQLIEALAVPQDKTNTQENNSLETDIPILVEDAEISKTSDDSVFGSTLKLSCPSDGGPASPTGRRSSCFLQRLEGGVGVGESCEVRQDVGLQVSYCSFLTKAAITVDKQPPGPLQMSSDRDDLTLDDAGTGMEERQTLQTGGTPQLIDIEGLALPQDKTNTGENNSLEGNIPILVEEAEINKTSDEIVLGSTLKLSCPSDGGPASPTGRKSPCFLQRLEGGVGVGVSRELRQNLGLQGGYSSFLSKAAITVDKQPPGPLQMSSDRDDLTLDDSGTGMEERQTLQTGGTPQLIDLEGLALPQDKTNTGENNSLEGNIPILVEEAEINKTSDEIVLGSTLKLSCPSDGGPASPTGRKSPCFLQRLEGGVGVGVSRELRQDLGLQGGYSSFLSKAAITVEDANLVLEGPGDQSVVRSKIYDYYVESSSHSLDSQSGEFRSRHSSHSESPSSLSPIIIRDLVLLQSADGMEDAFPPVRPEPRTPSRPILLRKESYLTAAKHSELDIATPTPKTSTPIRPSQAPYSRASSSSSSLSPTSAPSSPNNTWAEQNLETVAGARFLHLSTENIGNSELEGFAGKLDLGNCIEVLSLAKKRGQTQLQYAALRVMSDNYLQALRDPGLYGKLMAGEREQIQRMRMRGRQFLVTADMDPQDWMRNGALVAQTDTPRRTFSGLHYYDDYKDTWHPLCPIPQEVISKGCAMCTMDNYLFVALGCQGTEREMKPSKRVFCYNPVTSIWKEISPMNEARPHCKLAALQGHVYAIGGECLSTVERYDPRNDRWTFVAPLPNDTFAVAHRVTASNEELFVSGGTLRYTLLRYNPKTNAWKKSLIVGSKERTTEMVAVRNFLYRFDVNPTLGVSVYRYHMVARLWYECCSKRLLHCPAFQCVAADDTIYCVSRQFTMRFLADEISPAFIAEDLSVLAAAKGVVFPFILSLPDKKTLQTSV